MIQWQWHWIIVEEVPIFFSYLPKITITRERGVETKNQLFKFSSTSSSTATSIPPARIFFSSDEIINGCCYIRHLAVGYLPCYFCHSRFVVVVAVPLFWFWSSFLVYCLSCQAPLHSINASTLMLFCSFNGVEIKTDQIKKSRCTYGKWTCNWLTGPQETYFIEYTRPLLCVPHAPQN